MHLAIEAVSDDLSGDFQFNTAISELMKLSNSLSGAVLNASRPVQVEAISALVRLLAPFAPHLAEEFGRASAVRKCSSSALADP